ncbi:MAG: futalosine hydrolase [Planctomycetaceae bacterium]|nr:futalosine hydrolase [Planctomycetaceae bacterium]
MSSSLNKIKWLILVPTLMEYEFVNDRVSSAEVVVEICGFGPIIPAAKAMELIAQHQPANVALVGIAGAYATGISIGTAVIGSEVACFGIGAGSGRDYQTAGEMGWMQWGGRGEQDVIGDVLPLANFDRPRCQVLTVCAAANTRSDVDARQRRFPDAAIEEMEGFSVAAAAKMCGVPFYLVRGISNRAGDRDKCNWKIREALDAATSLMMDCLER